MLGLFLVSRFWQYGENYTKVDKKPEQHYTLCNK